MSRILTVKQVAEKLHVKPLTVREYLRKGKIPGRKLGKSWLVVETDLEMYIRGNIQAEPQTRVSARGFLKQFPGNFSSEAFMAEKRAEVEEEERRFEERAKKHKGSAA